MKTKVDKAVSLMKVLEIPYIGVLNNKTEDGKYHITSSVRVEALYDILMDDDKLKILLSRLKNKAFW